MSHQPQPSEIVRRFRRSYLVGLGLLALLLSGLALLTHKAHSHLKAEASTNACRVLISRLDPVIKSMTQAAGHLSKPLTGESLQKVLAAFLPGEHSTVRSTRMLPNKPTA